MVEPTEFTGGPTPERSPRSRFLRSAIAGAVALIVLIVATLFLWQPVTSMLNGGSFGEPAHVHAFVQAAAAGNGAAMRREVTQGCVDDMNSPLCLGPDNYASWHTVATRNNLVFSYVTHQGDLVIYRLTVINIQSQSVQKYVVVFTVNQQGLITANRVMQLA